MKTNLVGLAEGFAMASVDVAVLGPVLVVTSDVVVELVPIKGLDKSHRKEFKKTAPVKVVVDIVDVRSEDAVVVVVAVPGLVLGRELMER